MTIVDGFTFVPYPNDTDRSEAFLAGYTEAHLMIRDEDLTPEQIEAKLQFTTLEAPMGTAEEIEKVKGGYLALKGALLEGIRL